MSRCFMHRLLAVHLIVGAALLQVASFAETVKDRKAAVLDDRATSEQRRFEDSASHGLAWPGTPAVEQ